MSDSSNEKDKENSDGFNLKEALDKAEEIFTKLKEKALPFKEISERGRKK